MQELFNRILENTTKNNACAVATVVSVQGSAPREVGAKMVIGKDGSVMGTIGGGSLEKAVIADALFVLKRKKSLLKEYLLDKKSGLQVCGGKISIFIDCIQPDKRLVICGGGHIGLELSLIAKLLNFYLIVIDGRKDFAGKKRFPHADRLICGSYREAVKKTSPDKNTYIVIVTHRHLHDGECLEAALKTDAGYVGMIGSRAKIKHVFGLLRKKGFKASLLKKVHSPIGLDIGAETPEEIAVAIAGEMISVKGNAQSVKLKRKV